jgi:integrase
MGQRGRRVRRATGVFQDLYGFAIVLRVGGKQYERRYTPDSNLDRLRQARADWRAELEQAHPERLHGTLAADVAAYLETLPAGPRAAQARLLRHWVDAHGSEPRHALTALQLRQTLARWQDKGAAASTLNHRRQALMNLYAALDGKHTHNPAKEVPRTPEPPAEARGIPMAVVTLILEQLEPSKTKARLLVMATTGLPQAQIARLQPRDVDIRHRTVFVTPRRKGAGQPGRTLPLSTDAVEAFKEMQARQAWGNFARACMAASFKRAVAKAKRKWQQTVKTRWPAPERLRPYDLRHAWLTEVYRRTGDLQAVAELALHANLSMTARYTRGAVSETAQRAVSALDGPGK